MNPNVIWAVLSPGEPARLESRARAIVMTEADEEDGLEPPFEVIPGSGHYHAIVGTDPMDVGAELQIAEELSLECDEPVYSIEVANDPWTVMSWRKGTLDIFFVTIMRGGEGLEEFAQPPHEFPPLPVVSEIKGERSPERILAALGIPAEWFVNE